MPESTQIRFGEFQVNLRAGEIRRRGIKLKMAEQPFQVLAALLEKPGEVVTREELRQKLWPNGTFVDFDHGLTKAVNRIRDVLGDSAESPCYVETLPRRATVSSVSRRWSTDLSQRQQLPELRSQAWRQRRRPHRHGPAAGWPLPWLSLLLFFWRPDSG
jgi:hypothetical protein